MTFRLDGEISRLRIPPPVPTPRAGAQLWQHTCFEAFIAAEGLRGYHEFNFAPSGEWAVHAFQAYRNGGPIAGEDICRHITARFTSGRLEVDALVRLDRLSGSHARARLRVGLSAVIETNDGLSYWALRHPAGKPDFHHPDGFALPLEASSAVG